VKIIEESSYIDLCIMLFYFELPISL